MSAPVDATISTTASTFKALSYAELIRKSQTVPDQVTDQKGETSHANGIVPRRNGGIAASVTPVNGRSSKGTTTTIQDGSNQEGEGEEGVTEWQEVPGRSKKESKADKLRASADHKALGGKKDAGLSRANPSTDNDTNGPLKRAEPRGAAQTVWRSLATTTKTTATPTAQTESPTNALRASDEPTPTHGSDIAGTSVEPPKIVATIAPEATLPETIRTPIVNIWQARKEKMSSSLPANAVASSSSSSIMKSQPTPAAAGSSSKQLSKGAAASSASPGSKKANPDLKPTVKSTGKNAGKASKPTGPLPSLADPTAWPDVSLAALGGSKIINAGPSNKVRTSVAEDAEETPASASVPSELEEISLVYRVSSRLCCVACICRKNEMDCNSCG